MNDTEKLVIARLLAAIEDADRPIAFTVRLSPRPAELDARFADNAAIFEQRAATLATATAAARALIG